MVCRNLAAVYSIKYLIQQKIVNFFSLQLTIFIMQSKIFKYTFNDIMLKVHLMLY